MKAKKFFAAVRSVFGLEELFVFGGLGFAWYGLHQVYEPASYIVVGIALFWLGVRR